MPANLTLFLVGMRTRPLARIFVGSLFGFLFVSLMSGCASDSEVRPGSSVAGQSPTGLSQPTSTTIVDSNALPAPKELSSFRVTDPQPPSVEDKELDSIPPEMQSKVELWIAYFQGKGRPHMERYLARSTRYIQLMKLIMKQNGLPEDLVYIALIESGFSSRATSRAAAVGYWQFIKGTGRRYGLDINSFVDERRDPVLATQAAAEYFKELYSVFGSWYLSMASYNVGENRVKREVLTAYSRDFWELARKKKLPKETANYVPKFIAARLIAKNPEKYGFSEIDYDKPQEFELVKVDKAVNLRTMAAKLGLEYEDFKLLNPRYRGEIAPPKANMGLELRVPVGQAQAGLQAAQESFVDKVQFIADAGETETYKVHSGDSLSTIARHFHTTVSWLRDVNDLKAGRKLRVGMRLQVPDRMALHHSKPKTEVARTIVPPTSASTQPESLQNHSQTLSQPLGSLSSTGTLDTTKPAGLEVVPVPERTEVAKVDQEAAKDAEVVTAKGVYYIVQPGDTLSSIADDYDSSIRELQKMNKLRKGSLLRVGMKLKVPKEEEIPKELETSNANASASSTSEPKVAPLAESVSHVVKSGESLFVIAKHYGVTVKEIQEANNLKKKSKIMEGMTLVIPLKVKPDSSVRHPRAQPVVGLHIRKISKKTYLAHTKLKGMRKKAKGRMLANVKPKNTPER